MTPGVERLHAREVLAGLTIGESPRWHDGRLWLCDWGTQEVVAVGEDGERDVVLRVPTTLPFSIDWQPDGTLLVTSGPERRVLRAPPGGALAPFADLERVARGALNEIVVDRHGRAYVNASGFEMAAGEAFAPGSVVLLGPDGASREVADGLAFPNGMAISADDAALIVAESYARRLTAFDIDEDGTLANRRVWADLGDGAPDGICLDVDGAVWYADVPHRRCVRVREGGEVLASVDVDRGCFACMLGGPGGDRLFVLAAEWRGVAAMSDGRRTGRVLVALAPSPHAGRP